MPIDCLFPKALWPNPEPHRRTALPQWPPIERPALCPRAFPGHLISDLVYAEFQPVVPGVVSSAERLSPWRARAPLTERRSINLFEQLAISSVGLISFPDRGHPTCPGPRTRLLDRSDARTGQASRDGHELALELRGRPRFPSGAPRKHGSLRDSTRDLRRCAAVDRRRRDSLVTQLPRTDPFRSIRLGRSRNRHDSRHPAGRSRLIRRFRFALR
jgi:hypothetical protein